VGDVPVDRQLQGTTLVPPAECRDKCKSHGVCARARGDATNTSSCRCLPSWRGGTCSAPVSSYCVNNCNNRGTCNLGWCKCERGWSGVDCSVSWEHDATKKPKEDSAVRPRIFVYDMPSAFTSGHLPLHPHPAAQPGCMHRVIAPDGSVKGWANAYSAQVYVHERILRSKYRTHDPTKADYFFVPLWQQCLSSDSVTMPSYVELAMNYVRKTWPYWDLTHGHRHLLVLPDDLGSCDLRRQILLWKNATFIQHNGLARTAKIGDSYSLFPCYVEGKDVMIPPTLGHRLGPNWESIQSNMDKAGYPNQLRTQFVFFAGRIPTVGTPEHDNTGGLHTIIFKKFHKMNGYHLVDLDKDSPLSPEDYAMNALKSRFCLAPQAAGWSMDVVLSIFYGCIPVVIQDDSFLPYHQYLPWDQLSINVPARKVEHLDSVLRMIDDKKIKDFQTAIKCVWPRLFWSSVVGRMHNEPGQDDAFDTLMTVLSDQAGITVPDAMKSCVSEAKPEEYMIHVFGNADKASKEMCNSPCAPGISLHADR